MTTGRADTLIVDAQIATMAESAGGYGVINRGAIAMADGRISWVGPAADCPIEAPTRWSAGGAWITPGLVDCHTHLIFGGSRVDEFERRLAGAGYEELSEVERVFAAAAEAGLPVKLHADQLSDLGGAGLAASFGALSADHLEHTSSAGVAALAEAGTIAVLLPGATYALGEEKRPPLAELRRAGVPMALATDLNPGSAPVGSLPLVASMGATLLGLQPDEALAGITRNAARALGLGEEIGTIEVGKRADLAVWDIGRPAELSYWVGADLCRAVWFDGALVHDQPVAGEGR